MKFCSNLSIALAAIGLAACQNASLEPRMTTMGYAFAPSAFDSFCRNNKRLCDSHTGVRTVDITPEKLSLLRSVNRQVNRQIDERDDFSAFGKADVWRLPTTVGDCEDYAILKKAKLLQNGWPAASLLLTVVRQPYDDEGHTLLTVRTTQGDYVLDNATDTIKLWNETNYRYFSVQSQGETGKWSRINAR